MWHDMGEGGRQRHLTLRCSRKPGFKGSTHVHRPPHKCLFPDIFCMIRIRIRDLFNSDKFENMSDKFEAYNGYKEFELSRCVEMRSEDKLSTLEQQLSEVRLYSSARGGHSLGGGGEPSNMTPCGTARRPWQTVKGACALQPAGLSLRWAQC